MQRELSYTELKNGCSADDFSFRSTAELEPLEGIIGHVNQRHCPHITRIS